MLGQLQEASVAVHYLLNLISFSHPPAVPSPTSQSASSSDSPQASESAPATEASKHLSSSVSQSGQPEALFRPQAATGGSIVSLAEPSLQQQVHAPVISHIEIPNTLQNSSHDQPAVPCQQAELSHLAPSSQQAAHVQQPGTVLPLLQQPAPDWGQGRQQQSWQPASPAQQEPHQQVWPLQKPHSKGWTGTPYYQLKLIREACHCVMTLAEKQRQPALMLPLLESMQQVSHGAAATLLRVLSIQSHRPGK